MSVSPSYRRVVADMCFTCSGKYDNLTNGDVTWVNSSIADATPKLTYINDAGNAIIKVDNVCRFD